MLPPRIILEQPLLLVMFPCAVTDGLWQTAFDFCPVMEPEIDGAFIAIAGYLNSAMCHLKTGSNLEAMSQCDKALEMDEKNEKGLFRRATVSNNSWLSLSVSRFRLLKCLQGSDFAWLWCCTIAGPHEHEEL